MKELKKLLDYKISASFPYPCPTWTDPTKICWYSIGFTVQQILDGFAYIQAELKRILSWALYKALELFGLRKFYDMLVAKANAVIDSVVKALEGLLKSLGIEIPGLDDIKKYIKAIQDALASLKAKIEIDFAPMLKLMQQIKDDIAAFKAIYDACHAKA